MRIMSIMTASIFIASWAGNGISQGIDGQINPSFSCQGATTVNEKAICDSPALAALDISVAKAYFLNKANSTGDIAASAQLLKNQRDWHKKLQPCDGNLQCLASLYKERLIELGGVPEAPNTAVSEDTIVSDNASSSISSDSGVDEEVVQNSAAPPASEPSVFSNPEPETAESEILKNTEDNVDKSDLDFKEIYHSHKKAVNIFAALLIILFITVLSLIRIRFIKKIQPPIKKSYLADTMKIIESGKSHINIHIEKTNKKIEELNSEESIDLLEFVVQAYGGVNNVKFLLSKNLSQIMYMDIDRVFGKRKLSLLKTHLSGDFEKSLDINRTFKTIIVAIFWSIIPVIIILLNLFGLFIDSLEPTQKESFWRGAFSVAAFIIAIILILIYEEGVTDKIHGWIENISNQPSGWRGVHTWMLGLFVTLTIVSNVTPTIVDPDAERAREQARYAAEHRPKTEAEKWQDFRVDRCHASGGGWFDCIGEKALDKSERGQ